MMECMDIHAHVATEGWCPGFHWTERRILSTSRVLLFWWKLHSEKTNIKFECTVQLMILLTKILIDLRLAGWVFPFFILMITDDFFGRSFKPSESNCFYFHKETILQTANSNVVQTNWSLVGLFIWQCVQPRFFEWVREAYRHVSTSFFSVRLQRKRAR